MGEIETLRARIAALQRVAMDKLNESYRDGSITGWEEHATGCYQRGLSEVLGIIDELVGRDAQ